MEKLYTMRIILTHFLFRNETIKSSKIRELKIKSIRRLNLCKKKKKKNNEPCFNNNSSKNLYESSISLSIHRSLIKRKLRNLTSSSSSFSSRMDKFKSLIFSFISTFEKRKKKRGTHVASISNHSSEFLELRLPVPFHYRFH